VTEPRAGIRLDKWLWQARFFKTRSLSARQISAGHISLNGRKISKPATMVKPQDRLEFLQGNATKVVEVAALGLRRGPAPEAQTLYLDLTPRPDPRESQPDSAHSERKGRPSKKDRREITRMWQNDP